ncbi:MAG: hypothetical protein R3Y23_05290 [Bacillota bacterium]
MDQSAVIYPMSITPSTQSLFRLSAAMVEHIDKDQLLEAVEAILPRFPTFAVELRSGFFHHYFDFNTKRPVVKEDNGRLFQKIDFLSNHHYMFRVSYFGNKINVDFFHALCDATGAMEFVKSLIYQYLLCSGKELSEQGDIKVITEAVSPAETQDAFTTYYRKYKLFGGVIGKMTGKDALQVKGKRFHKVGYGLIEGYIKTSALKTISKQMGCTITVLLSAVAMLSVAELHAKNYSDKDIDVMIPINLRKIFPSTTVTNFTSMAKCKINPNTTPRTVAAYAEVIAKELKREMDKDTLRDKICLSSLIDRVFLMKIMPLFLKTIIIKASKTLSVKTKQTMIISNMGVINLPECVSCHIKHLAFNSNVSRKVPRNMGVVSFGDTTTISFTRQLVSTEMERLFFAKLKELGISGDDIAIASNFREVKIKN